MNEGSLRARMTRAVSVCTVAAVTLALGGTAGCGIKLRQVPHGDVDTSTPPGLRSQQLIDMLNSNWPIGKQGVATMAAANKVDDYTEIMTKLWVDRPYKVSSVDLGANSSTVHLIAPYGANVDIGLRTNDKGDVDRLVPYQQPPTIANWSDVDAALSASGGRYSYRASKIVDGQCQQIAGTNTSQAMPLASVFKLYVLLAAGTAINAGTLRWDDQLTVTDRGKALGSSMDKLPTGSTVSVRTAAQKMISVSDNMGTDMLINRVGRHAIEKALADAGHHDPASMTPFPPCTSCSISAGASPMCVNSGRTPRHPSSAAACSPKPTRTTTSWTRTGPPRPHPNTASSGTAAPKTSAVCTRPCRRSPSARQHRYVTSWPRNPASICTAKTGATSAPRAATYPVT